MIRVRLLIPVCCYLAWFAAGCRSPYYADRGALFGGLTGAGVGAAIGDATGDAGAGALVGSAIGAITGAAVGETIDADLARSRAEIESRMERDTFMSAEQAKEFGIVDEVIEKRPAKLKTE